MGRGLCKREGPSDVYEAARQRASAIVSSSACCVPIHESVVSNDSVSACASIPRPPPPIVIAGICRLMGMFESVDPSPRFALNPSAVAAAEAGSDDRASSPASIRPADRRRAL